METIMGNIAGMFVFDVMSILIGITLLFCFLCFVKAILICLHYFWEHSAEEMEERLFLSAIIVSLFMIGLIVILSLLHKKQKGSWISIKKLYMISSMFYGSFLITGTLYEFIYDVSTRNLKFLEDEYGYINFYKAILKADWTKDGTGIIFAGVCILIIMLGVLRQCLYKNNWQFQKH